MKTHFIALLVIAASAFRSFAAPSPEFITHLGTYPLSHDTTLLLAKGDSGTIELTLRGVVSLPDGKGTYTPSTGCVTACALTQPYVFYWDVATGTLWWAAPSQIGFIDYHTPNSTKSGTCTFEQGTKLSGLPPEFATKIREVFKRTNP